MLFRSLAEELWALLGHAETLAYETWPQFDYVAGDTTGAWPVEQVDETFRQVVFIRPDIIVVYDRGRLGPAAEKTKWLATIAGGVKIADGSFITKRGRAVLAGTVLLPKKAIIKSRRGGQQMADLEIMPPKHEKEYEYLVVLSTSLTKANNISSSCELSNNQVNVNINFENKKYTVAFNRTGAVGGFISGQDIARHEFVRHIDSSYHHWQGNYLFKRWMKDTRFRDYVTEEDRLRFGGMDLADIPEPPKGKEEQIDLTNKKGTWTFNGFQKAYIIGSKCPNLNMGYQDFIIQVRLKLE